MTTPDPSDEGHIADTGTFKRFVEHEQAMDKREATSSKSSLWLVLLAIVVILVIAGVVWALAR